MAAIGAERSMRALTMTQEMFDEVCSDLTCLEMSPQLRWETLKTPLLRFFSPS